MTTFEINIIINQPIEIVNKALMIPTNFPFWQTDLDRFEVVKGKPGEIGSVGLLHYTQKGRTYILEDKLMNCDPGKKYVSHVTGEAIFAKVETNLNALGNKTEMILKWSGKGKLFILKLLLPFFRRKMIKQTRKELELFKKLVETCGADFNESPKNKVQHPT